MRRSFFFVMLGSLLGAFICAFGNETPDLIAADRRLNSLKAACCGEAWGSSKVDKALLLVDVWCIQLLERCGTWSPTMRTLVVAAGCCGQGRP
jgi:hypothetical protein